MGIAIPRKTSSLYWKAPLVIIQVTSHNLDQWQFCTLTQSHQASVLDIFTDCNQFSCSIGFTDYLLIRRKLWQLIICHIWQYPFDHFSNVLCDSTWFTSGIDPGRISMTKNWNHFSPPKLLSYKDFDSKTPNMIRCSHNTSEKYFLDVPLNENWVIFHVENFLFLRFFWMFTLYDSLSQKNDTNLLPSQYPGNVGWELAHFSHGILVSYKNFVKYHVIHHGWVCFWEIQQEIGSQVSCWCSILPVFNEGDWLSG